MFGCIFAHIVAGFPVAVAQFVQAGVGYGNTSVRTKRLPSSCWGNQLLSPGNFGLFGQHSDLSPGNFLLVHANCLNVNTDIKRLFLPYATLTRLLFMSINQEQTLVFHIFSIVLTCP